MTCFSFISNNHTLIALQRSYDGAEGSRWIGKKYNLIDDEGYFTEFDGSRSRVIHQYDRLGVMFSRDWLSKQDFYNDPWPVADASR
jgi:hypothetical protein